MKNSNSIAVFFALLRAGLWEKEVRLSEFGEVDYEDVMRLAEEQSLVGLVTAGLERVMDVKVPQEILLQFIGQTLQIEQQNKSMNEFVAKLFILLQKNDIEAILVKGQGIAQCYEMPLWRSPGDVDLLLDCNNYKKAKSFLATYADKIENDNPNKLHQAMTISSWEVELHGTLWSELSYRIDKNLDKIQKETLDEKKVRIWKNGNTEILIPEPNNDVIFVFTHILQHYYKEGVGLRQICDWIRLLWIYKDKIDRGLLEERLLIMGIVPEWKAFAAFAVKFLGMPSNAMPLYINDSKLRRKAQHICSFILKVGNFGHNEVEFVTVQPALMRKFITAKNMLNNSLRHAGIFPVNSIKICIYRLLQGLKTQF